MSSVKRFVRVVWLDASDPQDDASWYRESEVDKFSEEMCRVESFGYLLRQTKLYVTLVADEVVEGVREKTYGRLTKIPVSMVESITDIPIPET